MEVNKNTYKIVKDLMDKHFEGLTNRYKGDFLTLSDKGIYTIEFIWDSGTVKRITTRLVKKFISDIKNTFNIQITVEDLDIVTIYKTNRAVATVKLTFDNTFEKIEKMGKFKDLLNI